MYLLDKFESFLATHQLTTNRLVLGLSGGIDSVVLLNLLHISSIPKEQIIAVHVNHGLSENATDWEEFCQQLCQIYGIHYKIENVTLTNMHLGIEGAAREARYQALGKHINKNSVLLTAQHQDDQTETLLLALKRGSGVLGLGGMRPITPFTLSKIPSVHARPLLNISQDEINEYAREVNLKWIEDESNLDNRFDRNFLRNDIINQLNERWPSFSANAARTAMLCQQQMELSDEIAILDFNNNNQSIDMLSTSLFFELSDVRINNLIRYWLRINQVVLPSTKQLEQIKNQCINAKTDKSPVIYLGSTQIRYYAHNLYIVNNLIEMKPLSLICNTKHKLSLPNGLGCLIFNSNNADIKIKAPAKGQIVTIEFGLSGSTKAKPYTRDKRRSLKKLWQEYAIPPWKRNQIPYLCFDGVLVAAIGFWIETDFMLNENNDVPMLTIEYNQFH